MCIDIYFIIFIFFLLYRSPSVSDFNNEHNYVYRRVPKSVL